MHRKIDKKSKRVSNIEDNIVTGAYLLKPRVINTCLIFLLAVLLYIPVLRARYIWDDDDYLTENQTLQSVQGLGRIRFEPGATLVYYNKGHLYAILERLDDTRDSFSMDRP